MRALAAILIAACASAPPAAPPASSVPHAASRRPPPPPPPPHESLVDPPRAIVAFVAGHETAIAVSIDGRALPADRAAKVVALLAGATSYMNAEEGCVTAASLVQLAREGRVLELEVDHCGHVGLAHGKQLGNLSEPAQAQMQTFLP